MEIAAENKLWLLDVMILFVFVRADEIHVQVLFKLVEIWNVFEFSVVLVISYIMKHKFNWISVSLSI